MKTLKCPFPCNFVAEEMIMEAHFMAAHQVKLKDENTVWVGKSWTEIDWMQADKAEVAKARKQIGRHQFLLAQAASSSGDASGTDLACIRKKTRPRNVSLGVKGARGKRISSRPSQILAREEKFSPSPEDKTRGGIDLSKGREQLLEKKKSLVEAVTETTVVLKAAGCRVTDTSQEQEKGDESNAEKMTESEKENLDASVTGEKDTSQKVVSESSGVFLPSDTVIEIRESDEEIIETRTDVIQEGFHASIEQQPTTTNVEESSSDKAKSAATSITSPTLPKTTKEGSKERQLVKRKSIASVGEGKRKRMMTSVYTPGGKEYRMSLPSHSASSERSETFPTRKFSAGDLCLLQKYLKEQCGPPFSTEDILEKASVVFPYHSREDLKSHIQMCLLGMQLVIDFNTVEITKAPAFGTSESGAVQDDSREGRLSMHLVRELIRARILTRDDVARK